MGVWHSFKQNLLQDFFKFAFEEKEVREEKSFIERIALL